ncbi:MAG: HAD-IA family hydrolase [Thermoguttaceae bacterium]|jgi:HAD superfamily hydrolase (TIGR01509 family)
MHVVFDLDGLMFNTEEIYTVVGTELLRRRGFEFTPALKDAMMGLRPQPSFEMMIRWCGLPETWEALADESNALFLELLRDRLAPMPGLFDLLSALETAGIPKAIATSSSRALAQACLEPLDLLPRFRFVLTAEDIIHGKPDPEIYLQAAARFGIAPPEMLVLEDSQNGARAAVAAGAVTVAVPGAHSSTHDFSGVALVAGSLADPRLYRVIGVRS